MKYKIFVDGQEGTTGLQIHERLAKITGLEILQIDPEKRKDINARKALLNEADVAFLCLPDAAAKESVSLVENKKTRIIDASTAHRTAEGWIYGIPELNKNQRNLIKNSTRVTNPGCYATGFAMALYPLVQAGFVPKDYPITCNAISGYSGGGKKLIEAFETKSLADCNSPKHYAFKLEHKHVPEMQKVAGLTSPPLFAPVVANFYKGMSVSIPLVPRLLDKKLSGKEIRDYLAEYYAGERFVNVMPFGAEDSFESGFLNMEACNGTNSLDIFIFGNDKQILLMSRLDNLGKGASGAAIQNMNIMLDLDEGTGLEA